MRVNIYSVKQVKEASGNYVIDEAKINSPQSVDKLIRDSLDLHNESVEVFGILALTTKNKIAGLHVISRGTLNSCIVHPREVFKSAILNNANTIIAFHNHPSGDTTPSNQDIEITKRLKQAGEVLGIELLDHIIVGDNFYSLKEGGYI